jgi:hypothetical protein
VLKPLTAAVAAVTAVAHSEGYVADDFFHARKTIIQYTQWDKAEPTRYQSDSDFSTSYRQAIGKQQKKDLTAWRHIRR